MAMALQVGFCSAKSVPLAESEISFPGVPVEDVGESEWLDLGPVFTPGAGTGVHTT